MPSREEVLDELFNPTALREDVLAKQKTAYAAVDELRAARAAMPGPQMTPASMSTPTAPAAPKKPKKLTRQQALDALFAPEAPGPTPLEVPPSQRTAFDTWKTGLQQLSEPINNLQNLPKAVTEGLPAAGKAFFERQNAPTYGDAMKRDPYMRLTGIPHLLSFGERAMRLAGPSWGAAAAELGPERAKPLTENIVSSLAPVAPSLASPLLRGRSPLARPTLAPQQPAAPARPLALPPHETPALPPAAGYVPPTRPSPITAEGVFKTIRDFESGDAPSTVLRDGLLNGVPWRGRPGGPGTKLWRWVVDYLTDKGIPHRIQGSDILIGKDQGALDRLLQQEARRGTPGPPMLERGPIPMGPTPPIPMGPVPKPVRPEPGPPPKMSTPLLDEIRDRLRRERVRPAEAPPAEVPDYLRVPKKGELLDAQGRPIPEGSGTPPSMTERERLRSLYRTPLNERWGEPLPKPPEASPGGSALVTGTGKRVVQDPEKVFGVDVEGQFGPPPASATRGMLDGPRVGDDQPARGRSIQKSMEDRAAAAKVRGAEIKAKAKEQGIKIGPETEDYQRSYGPGWKEGKKQEQARIGASPTSGATPRARVSRSAPAFEHGQPNLSDPDDVSRIIRAAGGLRDSGEVRDMPLWARRKNGTTLDKVTQSVMEQYPGLGDPANLADYQRVKGALTDTLSSWKGLVDAKKAAAKRPPPDVASFADQTATEIRTGVPPKDIPVSLEEWGAMPETQRKGIIDFFRDTMADESGRLDLAQMAKAWKRFRQKFPMEEAVRKAVPNSPVISEVERFNVGLADWISTVTNLSWRKGIKRLNPELLKDAEEAAVQDWITNGKTAQAAQAARRHFPPEVQQAMAHRDARLISENRARQYFGLEPIHEQPGPYIPRHVDPESRHAVSLGAGRLGQGRGIQTGVRGHAQERAFETFRAGEKTGLEYGDPRNSILLREWEGMKLKATERLFRNLEGKTLFRDKASAQAASPTGQPWAVENAPGGTWYATSEQEAKFLQQNLSAGPGGPTGSIVHYANSMFRNPNLVNPAPHIVKNMALKATLARGPVAPFTLARDAVEYFRGANPNMLRDFKEAMPFSETAKTAEQILTRDLQKGPLGETVKKLHDALGLLNRPSQKVIFEWADPAMRYSLYKHYRGKGMGVYEAGNHAWTDLIRYGTRSTATDFWKLWPGNFFVPWRFGTFASLVKQTANHPVRTALLIGAMDYLREARYRATGRWTHLPYDYVEKPLVTAIEDPKEALFVLGTTAAFGPGGEYGARQLRDMVTDVMGKGQPMDQERLRNAFWGLSQMYRAGEDFAKGDYGNMLSNLLIGEHNTHFTTRSGKERSYIPRRAMRTLPEWLPGLKKSPGVQDAEDRAAEAEERRRARAER